MRYPRCCLMRLVLCILIAQNMVCGMPCIPSAGNTLLIVGQDTESIYHYSKHFGAPGGTMSYISLQNLTGLMTPTNYGSGEEYAQGLITNYPNTALNLGLWLVGMLEQIPQGIYDTNLVILASWLNSISAPVFLRIGYEFDNPDNQYAPNDYREAFIYIVDTLQQQGVENALYVWHSWGEEPWDGLDIAEWYPGEPYVDVVGVSIFQQPFWNRWVFLNRLGDFAKQQAKPLMICESTPFGGIQEGSESWKTWFRPVLKYIKKYQVEVFSYINCNWETFPMWKGVGFGDTRIQAYPAIENKWKSDVLNSSSFLEQDSNFIASCSNLMLEDNSENLPNGGMAPREPVLFVVLFVMMLCVFFIVKERRAKFMRLCRSVSSRKRPSAQPSLTPTLGPTMHPNAKPSLMRSGLQATQKTVQMRPLDPRAIIKSSSRKSFPQQHENYQTITI